MRPAHWGDMGEQCLGGGFASIAKMIDGAFKIERVPVCDGSDDEIQPRGAIGLVL